MPRVCVPLILLLLLSVPETAVADPFSYRETISGDLPMMPPVPRVFALGLGRNTISGDIYFDISRLGTPEVVDLDAFAFAVPLASRLTRIGYDYAVSFVPPRRTTGGSVDYRLNEGNMLVTSEGLGVTSIKLFGEHSIAMFTVALPLGPGIYTLDSPGGSLDGASRGWFVSYTWSLDVAAGDPSPVPEPTTIALFGIGLALIALGRRTCNTPDKSGCRSALLGGKALVTSNRAPSPT